MNLLRIPQTVKNIQRFRQIAAILVETGFAEVLIRLDLAERWWLPRRRGDAFVAESLPQRFAAMLERLGPSFIKLGQILSTRADLFDDEWVAALARLQDTVAPLDFAELEPLVTAVTGPLDAVFAEFERTPLATASVSQVHAAVLKDGTAVVVKVVRPGIRAQVAADVDLMRIFASLLEQRIPELKAFRPTGVVAEFERAITREMDLRREARNIERFQRNFAGDDRVVVPRIWRQWCDRNVLVMERIDGVRITDYERYGNDPKVLAQLGVEVVFKMAFSDGFFHADPHPGNIWTLPHNRIALLDMGMADFVMPDTRDLLVDLLFAVVSDDVAALVAAVRKLGDVPDTLDSAAFKRDVVAIYEDFVRGVNLEQIEIADLITACVEVARKHRIVIPTDLTLLLKGLATIEGIGKQLDPELDIVAAVRPHVSKLIGQRWGPERLAKQVLAAAAQTYELAIGLPGRGERLLHQLERGQLTTRTEVLGLVNGAAGLARVGRAVALALLVVATTIAGAALWQAPVYTWRGVPVVASVLLLFAAGLGSVVVLDFIVRGRK